MSVNMLRVFVATTTLAVMSPANAIMSWNPVTVPVDSPWAIAGLGAVLAVVGARLIRNRRK